MRTVMKDGELCKQFMTPPNPALGPTHPLFQRVLGLDGPSLKLYFCLNLIPNTVRLPCNCHI